MTGIDTLNSAWEDYLYNLERDGSLTVIQLTDTHLLANHHNELLGVPTCASLQAVLNLVTENHPVIDAMLVTGDMSQDGSFESYQRLANYLKPINSPSFWIPGNHDAPTELAKISINKTYGIKQIISPFWQIIMLDSQVVGTVGGEINGDEWSFLTNCLTEHPSLHTMVCLHHHPIPMDSRWIDTIGLKNGTELINTLMAYKQVKAVVWGHVHQVKEQACEHIQLFSAPSTCVQFKPDSEQFALDEQGPGYRWFQLHPSGEIESAVERVPASLFKPDLRSTGY